MSKPSSDVIPPSTFGHMPPGAGIVLAAVVMIPVYVLAAFTL